MDIFSTQVLNGVVASLLAPPSALLDRYFPSISSSDKELISFDVQKGKRRIAPFVSPLVEGKIVESLGSETKTFVPAYVKDKRRFDSQRPFKRALGEAIGGTLSAGERMQRILMQDLEDMLQMLTRRQEVMASEAIRTGKVTVVGDNYPQVVVDFLRSANLVIAALAGNFRWGQSTAVPLQNLRDWSLLVLKQVGAKANDVIMGTGAWGAFVTDPTVKDRLIQFNIGNAALSPQPTLVEGLTYMGTLDGFNLFVYAGWYVDPADNTEKEIWPTDQVAVCSAALEGVRNYGAIQDHDALVAQPYFVKSWLEDDPSARFVMMQSAPLPVTTRPDGAMCVDVM